MATYNGYNPLVYQSFGGSGTDPNSVLSKIGSNYGYEGAYDPVKYPNLTQQGKFAINNQVFSSKSNYDAFNSFLGSRASFLDDQAKNNPEAYGEYIKSPYAFQGNTPFKTSAQKAAEAAAAKAAATSKTQGGTVTSVGTTATPTIGTGTSATPIVNRIRPSAALSGNINPATGLPEIPANNEALIGELKKLLGDVPGLFDVKGITKGFNDRINLDESFGHQTADNAASQFAAQTRSEGGDASLSGLVRAQALLPVLQHSTDLRSELADKRLAANTAQGSLTANIAQLLGNLRTNYLSGLVDYTSKIQDIQATNQTNTNKLAETAREFDLGHSLDVDKLALLKDQSKNDTKDKRLQALLAIAKLSGSKVNPGKNSYYPGISEGGPNDPNKVQYNDTLDSVMGQLQGLY